MPVSVLISRDKEGKLKQVINLKIRAQFWLTALGLFYSGQKGQEIKITISCLIFRYYCRVHYVKYQAGWITSWNQDCLEKYQQLQICRWYNSNGEIKRDWMNVYIKNDLPPSYSHLALSSLPAAKQLSYYCFLSSCPSWQKTGDLCSGENKKSTKSSTGETGQRLRVISFSCPSFRMSQAK